MEDLPLKQVADFLPLTATNSRRFVEAFSSQISAQAMRFGLPLDLVQDVVQETLLRALRALPRFRGDSKLSTWVFRIAYRECLRAQKKLKKHTESTRPLDGMQEIQAVQMESSQQAAQKDEVTRVRMMMVRLPTSQRLALGYHYLDQLSVAEIATLMGSTPNTVKSWLLRGRQSLRQLLESSS